MQKPDQRNHHDHRNPKKHDPAVVMQVPVKESSTHTSSKFGDHTMRRLFQEDTKFRRSNLEINHISEDYREDLINHCAGAARAFIVIGSSFTSKSEIPGEFKSKDDGGDRSERLFLATTNSPSRNKNH